MLIHEKHMYSHVLFYFYSILEQVTGAKTFKFVKIIIKCQRSIYYMFKCNSVFIAIVFFDVDEFVSNICIII